MWLGSYVTGVHEAGAYMTGYMQGMGCVAGGLAMGHVWQMRQVCGRDVHGRGGMHGRGMHFRGATW